MRRLQMLREIPVQLEDPDAEVITLAATIKRSFVELEV